VSVLDDRKNEDFVQLYRRNMPEVRWLMRKHSLSACILTFLMEHMDKANALACSYDVLQEYFECSRATIYRAIKVLEDNGFIGILKSGNSNVYILNHEIAWSSWNNKKKYAKLDGVILVSHKENKDFEISRQNERFKTLRKREGIKETSGLHRIACQV
jgi:Fe2+ or Zn2+ uptake regulation protein